jgi:hypothetical protein
MKDVFVTLIFIWLLWKLFGGKTIVHRYTFNQNHTHTYDRSQEGKISVDKPAPKEPRGPKKLKDDAGEYVYFEEIK